jgi:cytidine deaminase
MDNFEEKLIEEASKAKENAYAPYSKFRVGAALLTDSGKIYRGANVENASYGLTICAERVAVFSAVISGERNFVAIAIISDSDEPIPPCGACLQVLNEFSPDMTVILRGKKGKTEKYKLKDLFPKGFIFKPV